MLTLFKNSFVRSRETLAVNHTCSASYADTPALGVQTLNTHRDLPEKHEQLVTQHIKDSNRREHS